MKHFEKDLTKPKVIVYCETPNNDAVAIQIIKKCNYTIETYPINLQEFSPDTPIHSNEENIFCHSNGEVSMLLGRLMDVNNVIIPHTYEVRVIGRWWEE